MELPAQTHPRPRSRLLLHGESIVAHSGLAIAAILLVATAAAGLGALHLQGRAVQEQRQAALRQAADMLAGPVGERLHDEDGHAHLRLLFQDAVRQEFIDRCRLTAPDGSVVEVSDGTADSVAGPAWSHGQRLTATATVRAPDGGQARLELFGPPVRPVWSYWEAQAGLGIIGAASLVAFLLVYRWMRRRLRALGAIREAMLAMRAGESAADALAISPQFGPEAEVWNGLLEERERLRAELLVERARESMGARRDLKADLAQACDAMSQGLVLVDESLKAKYANGAAAAFLGTKREQIVGADVASLINEPAVLEAIRGVATGQVRRRTTEEVRRPEEQGGGVLRFGVRPVRRDDGAAALVTIEDITQQRIADEARNAFVAQATHELRTPLTNIRLYVEQALEEGEEDAALRARCLNVINQESRRLERIVADMLSVAEIEAGSLKMRPADVRPDALFEEIEADYRAQAEEKGIALKFELPPKWPVMRGDRDKIVLALHNLVGNALKYTPAGGSVTVKVNADDDRLVVDVTDTGIGIREEEAELIFEKFYRARDRRLAGITGSGLGLALARDVVRLHGGDITVRSQLDHGSTFTLTLPTRAEAA